MSGSLLEVRDLYHHYGDEVAVREISFSVRAGEFVTLVGPSGCGKTTTLKSIAGLVRPTGGEILLDGRSIVDDPPRKRPCSLVFQSLALFPHMSAGDNLSYPLETLGVPAATRRARIREMCALVGLEESLLRRPPSQLSGGQQQRVALARSLIYDPKLLLLDEPLSAIDFQLRRQLRKMLSDLHKQSGKTFLYVTHSLEEALSLSDVIIVMSRGEIVQRGSPEEIYAQPANRFVGEFMGDANVFFVRAVNGTDGGRYEGGELGATVAVERNNDLREGYLVLRAHEVMLARERRGANGVEAEVFNRYDLGGAIEYSLTLSGTGVSMSCVMEKSPEAEFSPGEKVYAEWPTHAGTIVPD